MPLKKLKRAVKKVVRKVVPKELSGIMTAAAPFVAPYSLPAAAALTIGGQLRSGRGRINPLTTALSLLPGVRFQGGQGIGAFKPTGFTRFGQTPGGFSARDLLLRGYTDATGRVREGIFGGVGESVDEFLFGRAPIEGGEVFGVGDLGRSEGFFKGVEGTKGLLGEAGKLNIGKGSLIRKDNDKLNFTNIAALATAGFSLTQTQEQIEEEGEDAGLSSSEIARLQQEAAEMWEDFDTTAFKPNVAQGGLMRTNYALGSRPTEQESGLGGLPIEADMRYSGGFMPYGAKEKADDVPARLSKNEFVFTADAVRGAGGGDINTGAKRMYQSMKQLEQMGKRT